MFSLKSCTPFCSIAVWGAFIASVMATVIVDGASGVKETIGGLLLQFIGTIYWGARIRSKPSLFVRVWVTNESPDWERLLFGSTAFLIIMAGQLFVILRLLK